jgi:glycosyltransferase involved in cell wall biosynthesis
VIAPIGAEKELFNNSVNLTLLPVGDTKKNFIINTLLINRALNFLKAIQKEKPDIIHLQQPHHLWNLLLFPLRKKYPILATVHDAEPHIGFERLHKIIARNWNFKYLSRAFIVHGQVEKDRLEKSLGSLGIKKKCYVVSHGDYSFFTKYSKTDIQEINAVLFFGQITQYKGLEYLLKASPLISKKIPDAKIIIAGKGDLRKYANLMETIDNIEIHNRYIPNEEVAMFFQRAKVVVLPYVHASQSGIIPIAYAFKKPVVVTNVGSIPEVVEDGKTGFIVPLRDSESLAEAIIKLLSNDELRKEMGKNAYIKMKRELSWDKIAEKTLVVYGEIVAKT